MSTISNGIFCKEKETSWMMGGFCICDYRHMKAALTKKDLFEDTDSEKWLFIFGVQMLNLTLYVFEGCKVSNIYSTGLKTLCSPIWWLLNKGETWHWAVHGESCTWFNSTFINTTFKVGIGSQNKHYFKVEYNVENYT